MSTGGIGAGAFFFDTCELFELSMALSLVDFSAESGVDVDELRAETTVWPSLDVTAMLRLARGAGEGPVRSELPASRSGELLVMTDSS